MNCQKICCKNIFFHAIVPLCTVLSTQNTFIYKMQNLKRKDINSGAPFRILK